MPIAEMEKRFKVASCDFVVTPERDDICVFTKSSKDPLTQSLIKAGKTGLILFSSGTTGEPKGMVRDLNLMVESYKNKKATDTALLMFLLFDHIGGIDTLFGALARGNRLVICKSRDAVTVSALIEKHGINVFSTSATFLALMFIADVFDKFNLGCLRRIAYGTEPMLQPLLDKLNKKLPQTSFLQTFGTSETGVIKTKSRSSDSLDIKFTDAEQEHKIVDGELWLRCRQSVLGYINAPNKFFTEDGWFKTGDMVEEKGEGWFKIVGRKRDVINVGGLKVLPAEIESFLLGHPQVADCTAYGIASPLTGQSVAVDIIPEQESPPPEDLKRILRRFCLQSLDKFKVPVKFKFVKTLSHGARFKKKRPSA